MSKLVAVVGESGTGKSTSIKHLDPKETYIINVAGKELPFKGSGKLYNRENKNYKDVSDAKEILSLLKTISEKGLEIKNIIIEDANYIMSFNLLAKAMETGFTKFNLMGQGMLNIIQEAKKLREDLMIFYFSHPEAIEDGDEIVSYRIKTSGKVLANQIVLEGLFTVVLYTYVDCKNDQCTYHFLTNRYLKYPGKSPEGMFDEIKIDNNLQLVIDKVKEYYN